MLSKHRGQVFVWNSTKIISQCETFANQIECKYKWLNQLECYVILVLINVFFSFRIGFSFIFDVAQHFYKCFFSFFKYFFSNIFNVNSVNVWSIVCGRQKLDRNMAECHVLNTSVFLWCKHFFELLLFEQVIFALR